MLDSPEAICTLPTGPTVNRVREANRHPSFHRRARLGLETHPYPHCPRQKLAKQEIEVGDGHVTKGQPGVILQGGEPPAVW